MESPSKAYVAFYAAAWAFGEEGRYTVYGISEARFFDSTDILVDISGVVRMMTSGSPLISALGDSFKPSGTVYVKTVGGRSAEASPSTLVQISTQMR